MSFIGPDDKPEDVPLADLFPNGRGITREPTAEHRKMAQEVAGVVSAYMSEGFTRAEAVHMTTEIMAAVMSSR